MIYPSNTQYMLYTYMYLQSHIQHLTSQEGVGDSNDVWQVDIVSGKEGDLIRTVTSRIKLKHVNIGCYLHSHSTQLPKW